MTRIYSDEVELYDIAFGWDLSGEADWLVERLGSALSVLEPGCGSGRMLAELAARGLEVVGLDSSEAMVALARARLHGTEARVLLGDMTSFDLGRRFDGAVSRVITFHACGVGWNRTTGLGCVFCICGVQNNVPVFVPKSQASTL